MWKVAVRPRWIAALILALAVAGAFAALSQWQLERSIASGEIVDRTTETVVPLESVAQPQGPMTEVSGGQLVQVDGEFVPGDFVLLEQRLNQGENGYWVVGHLTADGAGVAVALGWSATEDRAQDVLDRLEREAPIVASVTGRYLPSEAPQETEFEGGVLTALSAPGLVNLWTEDAAGIFSGYIVADAPVDGLVRIDSPPPAGEVEINWLNIFYAAEWVIFAGFAVFLWWRLVKDEWEREQRAGAQGEGHL